MEGQKGLTFGGRLKLVKEGIGHVLRARGSEKEVYAFDLALMEAALRREEAAMCFEKANFPFLTRKQQERAARDWEDSSIHQFNNNRKLVEDHARLLRGGISMTDGQFLVERSSLKEIAEDLGSRYAWEGIISAPMRLNR